MQPNTKNRILILGRGFIGSRIKQELGGEFFSGRIRTLSQAERDILRYSPKVLINSVGFIGRNVDDCELDKDKALMANTFIPIILAEVALRHGIKLVHISSGCIYHYDYERDKPIREEKTPDFFGLYYSRTKIYCEKALEVLAKKFPILIARIRVPLDNRPHPKNILDKLIQYKKSVVTIPNSVTYIPDFIKAIKHLIKINARGIYNVVNKGALRYPELLEVYKKYALGFEYKTIDFKKLKMVRTNLVMSTSKLEKSGFRVRDIHEVLEECVKEYIKY